MTDDERFDDFVRSRAPALYRYAYLLAGDHHDADDLVQEALIRLRRAWPRVRQEDPVGYTRTIIARLHLGRWRRRREYTLPEALDAAVDEPGYQQALQRTTIWRTIASLPPRQRAVIVLRFYEHLTDAEIAQTLGITSGTVRSQMFHALAKLRRVDDLAMILGAT